MVLHRYSIFCSILFGLLFVTGVVSAQNQVTLNPIKDNTLYEDEAGSLSNGAGIHMFVGQTNSGLKRRAVLAFDLTQIPSGAQVQEVTLTLNMSKTATGSNDVSLHKLTTDWGEGASDASNHEGGGTASTNNDATWVHTFFNTQNWATPGGDFEGAGSATASVGATGEYTWGSTTEMVADVQGWLDDAGTNFGWILIGSEGQNKTAKRFDTKESSNPPVLTVTFSPTTGVAGNSNQAPDKFGLAQNYPNPFNPGTVINYNIPANTNVTLEIFNILGEKVRTLVNTNQAAGSYHIQWNGRNDSGQILSSGVYVYRLQAGRLVGSKRMLFVK